MDTLDLIQASASFVASVSVQDRAADLLHSASTVPHKTPCRLPPLPLPQRAPLLCNRLPAHRLPCQDRPIPLYRLQRQRRFVSRSLILWTTVTFVPVSSASPTPIGLVNNARNPTAPQPFGFFPSTSLRPRQTTFWTTPPRPAARFFPRPLLSPQKANYIQQMMTPYSSSTYHACPLPVKPSLLRNHLPTRHPAYTFPC